MWEGEGCAETLPSSFYLALFSLWACSFPLFSPVCVGTALSPGLESKVEGMGEEECEKASLSML